MVVGGEEGSGAAFRPFGVEVFNDGPGDGEAVVGTGAPSNFVENDEAAGTGIVQDVGGLVHFDHEGRVAAGQFVACADSGEDAIDKAETAALGGYPGTGLGHQDD